MLRSVSRYGLDTINKILAPIDPLFSKDGTSPTAPLFIVGAPRSGTTLTYQIITQQMRVGYFAGAMSYLYGIPNLLTRTMKPLLGRPKPIFESRYGKQTGFLSPSENANFWFRWFPRDGLGGHYLEPIGLSLERYRALRDTVYSMTRIMGRHMVFKSVYLSMVVGALAQIFTDGRFIFVRRDRFLTCQSLFLARLKRPRPEDWWSVKIPGYRELRREPIWYQVVDQVVYTENIVQRDLERFAPYRHSVVCYEDLCNHPCETVNRLEEWLRPAGYSSYPDIRVPKNFMISNRVTVPASLAARIEKRLGVLAEERLR